MILSPCHGESGLAISSVKCTHQSSADCTAGVFRIALLAWRACAVALAMTYVCGVAARTHGDTNQSTPTRCSQWRLLLVVRAAIKSALVSARRLSVIFLVILIKSYWMPRAIIFCADAASFSSLRMTPQSLQSALNFRTDSSHSAFEAAMKMKSSM